MPKVYVDRAMTQAGAAREIGIDPSNLSKMIQNGRIKTVETADGLRLIATAEVKRFIRQRTTKPFGDEQASVTYYGDYRKKRKKR